MIPERGGVRNEGIELIEIREWIDKRRWLANTQNRIRGIFVMFANIMLLVTFELSR